MEDPKDKRMYVMVKGPDTTAYEGKLSARVGPNFATDYTATYAPVFGGNDNILALGYFMHDVHKLFISVKNGDGEWYHSTYNSSTGTVNYNTLQLAAPGAVYGGPDCHPLVGDFDGDNFTDRAVMCPEGWYIMYSDPEKYTALREGGTGLRFIALPYDSDVFSLPGRAYAGGTSYAHVKSLIETYQELNPTEPPPIPVDMISASTE